MILVIITDISGIISYGFLKYTGCTGFPLMAMFYNDSSPFEDEDEDIESQFMRSYLAHSCKI